MPFLIFHFLLHVRREIDKAERSFGLSKSLHREAFRQGGGKSIEQSTLNYVKISTRNQFRLTKSRTTNHKNVDPTIIHGSPTKKLS